MHNDSATVEKDVATRGRGARAHLDITGASSANGTLIEWWTCNGGANQKWSLP